MYGTDMSQAAGLSTAAAAFSVGWDVVAVGVVLFALAALLTIVAAVRHRGRGARPTSSTPASRPGELEAP